MWLDMIPTPKYNINYVSVRNSNHIPPKFYLRLEVLKLDLHIIQYIPNLLKSLLKEASNIFAANCFRSQTPQLHKSQDSWCSSV